MRILEIALVLAAMAVLAYRFAPEFGWQAAAATPARAPVTDSAPPAGCHIKGNISDTGERIYHVPGQRHYEATRIDRVRGERWFCSEQDARRAGLRKARV